MALWSSGLDPELFRCALCGQLLREPASVPCGHSFCLSCLSAHWDQTQPSYSCPQCGHWFSQRPVLSRNTVLDVVMKQLRKRETQTPAKCELCPENKSLRADKKCDLQRHEEVPAIKRPDLEEPEQREQGTVTAERRHRLEQIKQNLHQKLSDKEEDKTRLLKRLQTIRDSADGAVKECDRALPELTRLLEIKLEKMKRDWRTHQEKKVHKFENLKKKLEEDIPKLTAKQAELERLEQTADPIQFLQKFQPFSEFVDGLDYDVTRPGIFDQTDLPPLCVVKSDLRDLQHELHGFVENQEVKSEDEEPKIDIGINDSRYIRGFDRDEDDDITHISVSDWPMFMRRHLFLQYARDLTFEPNSAHVNIVLSNENRKAELVHDRQNYRKHPERFTSAQQVLSKEPLTGRCYFEVEISFDQIVTVALTYKDIKRKGLTCANILGSNKKSWAFECFPCDLFRFVHNDKVDVVWWNSADPRRLGVFVDQEAGIVEYYTLDDEPEMLFEVHTTFTQPLYLAVRFDEEDSSVEICKLTET
ncbi:hypothetical protein WMY93_025088 [Mugilogobius chulae]|uniref:RING-type domain-containing protein n=1 Tax=Mugilogobius chulae TaxID=88201 RepID=A0AAW0N4P8_9GOBI